MTAIREERLDELFANFVYKPNTGVQGYQTLLEAYQKIEGKEEVDGFSSYLRSALLNTMSQYMTQWYYSLRDVDFTKWSVTSKPEDRPFSLKQSLRFDLTEDMFYSEANPHGDLFVVSRMLEEAARAASETGYQNVCALLAGAIYEEDENSSPKILGTDKEITVNYNGLYTDGRGLMSGKPDFEKLMSDSKKYVIVSPLSVERETLTELSRASATWQETVEYHAIDEMYFGDYDKKFWCVFNPNTSLYLNIEDPKLELLDGQDDHTISFSISMNSELQVVDPFSMSWYVEE